VPSLWQLLNPSERPERFLVGGHRLDFESVGVDLVAAANGDFVYPENYQPWSHPLLIDTRARGLSNRGHESEFEDLSRAQKRALIEYLKLL
jgi:hypothetical protein